MRVDKAQIQSYIPQRPPFVMVDSLIEATSERFETELRVRPDNIFLEEETLREFALIENIAQSAAAGLSTVTIRLNLNHDSTKALAEVNARLQQVRSELPAEAEPPTIELRLTPLSDPATSRCAATRLQLVAGTASARILAATCT